MFLGHLISPNGFKPTSDKVEVIKKHPKPRTVEELCRFFGIIIFHRRCIPNAATLQAPLNALYITNSCKRDKHNIVWTIEAKTAFRHVKRICPMSHY